MGITSCQFQREGITQTLNHGGKPNQILPERFQLISLITHVLFVIVQSQRMCSCTLLYITFSRFIIVYYQIMCHTKNHYLADPYVYVGVVHDELVGDVRTLGFHPLHVGQTLPAPTRWVRVRSPRGGVGQAGRRHNANRFTYKSDQAQNDS